MIEKPLAVRQQEALQFIRYFRYFPGIVKDAFLIPLDEAEIVTSPFSFKMLRMNAQAVHPYMINSATPPIESGRTSHASLRCQCKITI